MSKVGRNSPCPCGSGKKYKKCCLAKDKEARWETPDASLFDNESVEDADDEYEGDDRDEEGEWDEDEDWAEEEDEGHGKADRHDTWDTESPYPQIDLALPDLPEDQQAIVDRWWDDFMPIYKKRDADEMVRRILDFMEAQPQLSVHLHLNDECLHELGAELARRGEHARHVDLLQRIRRDHPEVYVRSHGFYDLHIVAELILTGQRDAIPQYFSFFREYPDSHPDELSSLIDLLLATNCQAELFELVCATAVPCMRSPKVFGGGFAYHWYVFEQWVPFLDRGDPSEAACQELLDVVMATAHPFEPELEVASLVEEMGWAFDEDPATNLAPLCTSKTLNGFYRAVSWSFTRFLHENRGMTWATARFFAERLDTYLRDLPLKKRSKRPFAFEKQELDQYLAKNCMFFMWLQGVKAISLLQAIHEFAGYLEVNPVGPSEPPDVIRQVCLELLELCKKGAPDSDHGPRIFADFPEYRWAT